MKIENSGGKIFYGLHMYPGLAQYSESESDPKRVYLNEDTIRKMDPTFAGKPVFVEHVDEVDSNLDELRKEADGWVVESFFNSHDGKHWVKFIVVTPRAERAIKNGFRLSNAYLPLLNGKSGQWNAVPYQDEVIDGEYEHLAIVKNPRYEESVIMTPDEFKKYNENLQIELKRLSNSKAKENVFMGLKFWNRKPVENTTDLENLSVFLPRAKKEMTLVQLINSMDEVEEKKKENTADHSAMVKMHDGAMCNVGELVEKYKALHEEHEQLKSAKQNEEMDTEKDLTTEAVDVDVEGDLHNEDSDEEAKKKALELAEHEAKEIEEKKKEEKVANAKQKKKETFESIKNAHLNTKQPEMKIELSHDQVARGKARYGSN